MRYVILMLVLIAIAVVLIDHLIQHARSTGAPDRYPLPSIKSSSMLVDDFKAVQGEYPDDIRDANGNAILSWRVQLANTTGSHKEIDQSIPWYDPRNIDLARNVPEYFRPRDYNSGWYPYGRRTQVLGVRNEDGSWNGQNSKNGKILLVEGQAVVMVAVSPELAVFWTEPIDLTIDRLKWLLERNEKRDKVEYVGLEDGRVVGPPFEWRVVESKGIENRVNGQLRDIQHGGLSKNDADRRAVQKH